MTPAHVRQEHMVTRNYAAACAGVRRIAGVTPPRSLTEVVGTGEERRYFQPPGGPTISSTVMITTMPTTNRVIRIAGWFRNQRSSRDTQV